MARKYDRPEGSSSSDPGENDGSSSFTCHTSETAYSLPVGELVDKDLPVRTKPAPGAVLAGGAPVFPAPSELVARPRLTDRLLSSRDTASVIVISAPAGYSKSTCVAQWDAADERTFCWLSCGPRHDDPAVLVAAIVEALSTMGIADTGVLAALGSPSPDMTEVLSRLDLGIGTVGEPFVLVADDTHVLSADGIPDVLANVAGSLPAGSQLAICTRGSAGLPLGRLRANRKLLELDSSDLAMTHRESAQLLGSLGLAPDDGRFDPVFEATEGWPAALYLAGLVLRDDSGPLEEPRVAFAGDDRVVVEYFREEFFGGLTEEQARFLYLSSILEELTGPLCDAVLERSGSAAMLTDLAGGNAMVIPLDRNDHRFRYHHLFADMLRAELRLREPEMEDGLHRRASQWYEENGELERAVDHAIAGGYTGLAGELIWKSFPVLSGHGRMATLDRWVDELGEDRIKTSIPAMLSVGRQRMIAGRGGEAIQWFKLASRALEEAAGPVNQYAGDFHLISASFALEGNEKMLEDAEKAIATLAVDAPWQVPAYLYAGIGRHLKGDPEVAESLLRESARRGAAEAPLMQTLALSQLALVALEDGRPEEAARLTSQARRQVEMCGMTAFGSQVLVFAVSAQQRARDGQVAEARADIEWCRELLSRMNQYPGWYETEVHVLLSRASLRLGDVEAALSFLEATEAPLARVPDAPVLRRWVDETRQAIEGSREGLLAHGTGLTKSELRTLHFLPSHHSFRAIGEQLHLSQNTVKTQANSLYRKLGVNSRAEAVMAARRAGLLDPEPGGGDSPGSDDGGPLVRN